MSEVIIPLPEKAVREAVESKEFNELYITDLYIRAHTGAGPDTITIEYVPYDKETKEMFMAGRKTLILPLWQTVMTIPEAGQAFGAIAQAIPKLIEYRNQLDEESLNPPQQ